MWRHSKKKVQPTCSHLNIILFSTYTAVIYSNVITTSLLRQHPLSNLQRALKMQRPRIGFKSQQKVWVEGSSSVRVPQQLGARLKSYIFAQFLCRKVSMLIILLSPRLVSGSTFSELKDSFLSCSITSAIWSVTSSHEQNTDSITPSPSVCHIQGRVVVRVAHLLLDKEEKKEF